MTLPAGLEPAADPTVARAIVVACDLTEAVLHGPATTHARILAAQLQEILATLQRRLIQAGVAPLDTEGPPQ